MLMREPRKLSFKSAEPSRQPDVDLVGHYLDDEKTSFVSDSLQVDLLPLDLYGEVPTCMVPAEMLKKELSQGAFA